MKRMKKLLRTIEVSCWQKPQFVWAPLIPYLILGGASVASSVAGGLIGKSGADAQARMTDKWNAVQQKDWEKEFALKEKEAEMAKRQEVVNNLNGILKNNAGLQDRVLKIWGGSQRRGVL